MYPNQGTTERAGLEALIAVDARALAAESDQISRALAAAHRVHPSDFRALLHIFVAENGGFALTSGELRAKMGLSAGAITYLVDRLIQSGHIRRDSDPADRRKVILRYAADLDIASAFFIPLAAHTRAAMADLSDSELKVGHRVLVALIQSMRQFLESSRVTDPEVGTT
jgi:MarR family transcriptional regulator, organic hydroperoxide resistance regulator